MIKTRPVLGIVPVVDTPLTSEEEIDVPALRRLIEFLNSKRISHLVPNGVITLEILTQQMK